LEIFKTLEFGWAIILSIAVSAAFPIGALLSICIRYPGRSRADLGAFAAGVFFSTVAFSLVNESVKEGSFLSMIIGFASGAIIFSITDRLLKVAQSKASESKLEKTEDIKRGTGKAILFGTLIDSIPETLFIGASLAIGSSSLIAAVLALFLGNIGATMEGSQRMIDRGKGKFEILSKWTYVFVAVSTAGPIGYYLVKPLDPFYISIIIGLAAGALIALITEELIPQAYEKAEYHIGLSCTFGFLIGLSLFHFL
jgi:ZIP family zinc transporter